MLFRRAALLLSCLLVSLNTGAAAEEPVVLDTVLVSGTQSGPGLWQVRRGDHVLWILGTLSPLPRRMDWYSEPVEQAVAASQQVLAMPGVDFDAGVGPVRGLFLLPSLFAARRIPDDGTLEAVLPPELHARWDALKRKYMPRRSKVERWRPIFAAAALYEEAIEDVGLRQKDVVWPVVRRIAKKNGIPIVESDVQVTIAAPREAIAEFTANGLDDTQCFARTLERLETDLGAMKARANAWADGNIEALRALPFPDQNAACREAILAASVAEKNGMRDLPQRVQAAWLASAEAALRSHTRTFAVLPIARLLAEDGYLAPLRERGYEIVAPQ
ncbi:TraB/GumN family protein [Chiayiivirga flava]|uniref:Uncharacterized protein YbaP (TraB family) n=1 Tax=Chiayiivirga flava TaxID=659595 RepID=A0A7W8D3N2_9GAMM|nr:TraB/GumN family protein [Chiayiivirga flava]MBB5207319.1 uncharacterized protein YbaP (TraB family) [Chiayiivirga flava]